MCLSQAWSPELNRIGFHLANFDFENVDFSEDLLFLTLIKELEDNE